MIQANAQNVVIVERQAEEQVTVRITQDGCEVNRVLKRTECVTIAPPAPVPSQRTGRLAPFFAWLYRVVTLIHPMQL